MPKQFLWRPKIDRIVDLEEEARRKISWLQTKKYLSQYGGLEMRAYEEERDIKRIEQPELYWMPKEIRESPEVEQLMFAKKSQEQVMEMLPFIGAPAAMVGWRAVAPWIAQGGLKKGLAYGARALLSPFAAPEKALGIFSELGQRGVAKLVKKSTEAVSSYLQKLEAHRMARQAEFSEKFFHDLALETTGKESMAKMTQFEASKFIQAITDQGASREIKLPSELGLPVNKAREEAKAISLELAEYLGRVKPTKEMRLGQEKISRLAKLKEAKDNFTQRTYRIERILDEIDGYPKSSRYNVIGGKMSQVFYNTINKAEDTKLGRVISVTDDFTNFAKKNNINIPKLLAREVNIQGVPLSADIRLDIVANTLHKDNLKHLMSPKGNALTKIFIADTIKSLSTEEKQLLGWVTKYWQKDTPNVAKAFELVTGKKFKAVEGQYVPIVLERDYAIPFTEEMIDEATLRYSKKWASTMIKKGFTKARSGKATLPMELGLFQKFFKRLPEVEHYKSFTPVVSDLQRILNNQGFKSALVNKQGKPVHDVLNQWLKDVAQTNPLAARDWAERTMQSLRVNAVTAVLGWNITTALKQFPSYMIGGTRIGQINALKGLYLSLADRTGTTAMIKRLSPQIYKRSLEREIAENRFIQKFGARMLDKTHLREFFMFLTLQMDKNVVFGLWRGAFDDGLKKLGNEKLAADYATKAIRETQPFFTIKDLPELWRSQGKAGEILKVLTMFQNQLNQYWNFYRHIVYGGWRHKQIGTGEALKQFTEGFIIPALMIGAITRSDIARNPKDVLVDIGSMAFSSVPIVGQFVTSGLRGFRDTQGLISTELLERFQNVSYEMNREEWGKAAMVIPELAGYATGVPVSQPSRMIRAILDNGADVFDDWLQLIWGTYAREQVQPRTGGL